MVVSARSGSGGVARSRGEQPPLMQQRRDSGLSSGRGGVPTDLTEQLFVVRTNTASSSSALTRAPAAWPELVHGSMRASAASAANNQGRVARTTKIGHGRHARRARDSRGRPTSPLCGPRG